MELTIVMTYWNRRKQLLRTLKSINEKVKIIIVNDCSDDSIKDLETEDIKVIELENKTWVNPCVAFNIGFKEVQTDVVLLQNAECLHFGDIIGYTLENIKKGVYLNYSALSINENFTNRLDTDNTWELIKPIMNCRIMEHGGNGWYNHPVYRPEALHFCSGIMTEDLYSLGGFDERFIDGFGYEDNDFVNRIRKKGMEIKIIENQFVIHQHHPYFTNENFWPLLYKNENLFNEFKQNGEWDVKKYNTIYK